MQINLNEQEIQQALVEYISNKDINLSNTQNSVTLIAGRGANGHSAVIDVIDTEAEPEEATTDEKQQAIPFQFQNNDTDIDPED